MLRLKIGSNGNITQFVQESGCAHAKKRSSEGLSVAEFTFSFVKSLQHRSCSVCLWFCKVGTVFRTGMFAIQSLAQFHKYGSFISHLHSHSGMINFAEYIQWSSTESDKSCLFIRTLWARETRKCMKTHKPRRVTVYKQSVLGGWSQQDLHLSSGYLIIHFTVTCFNNCSVVVKSRTSGRWSLVYFQAPLQTPNVFIFTPGS